LGFFMTGNELPGVKRSYLIRAGEGQRLTFGGELATVVARNEDTGGLLEVIFLSGGKGATFPLHRHKASHESLYVLDGQLELWIDGKRALLSRNDYANIPAGVIHGYQMQSHRTQVLSWSVGSSLAQMYSLLGEPYPGHVHPESGSSEIAAAFFGKAQANSDVEFVSETIYSSAQTLSPVAMPPKGVEAYVIEAGEGERMIAGSDLFAFLAHQGNTSGQFISVTTLGPPGDRIPDHFHEKHTETFFCFEGKMTMWADGKEISFLPGDFLHVPAGTVHSYRIDAPFTRFMGVLAPGLFEPFFRIMCDPYDGYIFPLEPRPFRFDRVMQRLGELDLKLVGDPRPAPATQR
jgi:quercetin 2,3-dioxygenase